jgi:hypothetical protein
VSPMGSYAYVFHPTPAGNELSRYWDHVAIREAAALAAPRGHCSLPTASREGISRAVQSRRACGIIPSLHRSHNDALPEQPDLPIRRLSSDHDSLQWDGTDRRPVTREQAR